MSFFNIFKKKNPEDSPSFRLEMAKKIAVHRLRYVTEREGETELVIGRDGGFNIRQLVQNHLSKLIHFKAVKDGHKGGRSANRC